MPAFPDTSLSCLKHAYGASKFLLALKKFLQENFASTTLIPNEHDCFDVYKSVRITQHSQSYVSDGKHHKTIFATPEHSNGSRKKPSPACFDTVLVIEEMDLHCREGKLQGM